MRGLIYKDFFILLSFYWNIDSYTIILEIRLVLISNIIFIS